MVTPELTEYIRLKINEGCNLITISEILKQNGWKDEIINEAFETFQQPTQTPEVTPSKSNKVNLLILLNIINVVLILVLFIFDIYLIGQVQKLKNSQIISNQKTTLTTPTLTPVATATSTNYFSIDTPTATPNTNIPLKKSEYSIAVYGDSMVDTMGEKLDYLQNSLKSKYPNTKFDLYNYGTGAQTVQQGLDGFYSSFDYKTRHYASIAMLKPDVIIIASFAYNPYYPLDLMNYELNLSKLLEDAKKISANTYLLVEIAPLSYDFGKGTGGVPGWSDQARFNHANDIVQQLKAAIEIGTTEGVTVINVFDKTRVNGDFGSYKYTENYSGIHPSVTGHTLTANTIINQIILDK